ncbi:hypothetical protein [Photobacterium lucens]|uniref:hypothetical protein n=2 Tax=Photobacterium lucens TaxID=2562949 RepID=UPI00136F4427|nr:hypothetical protein [Photobacterium lucens]MBP2699133.1 hypothetical protein [Vibrio parahaemolyticus]MZG57640.1 hypothetical protein [Photobacterium lucens]MZG79296.1 hypothetical protein [Photobacterium lucens]
MTMDNTQSDKQQFEELEKQEALRITKDNKFKVEDGRNNQFLPPVKEIYAFLNIKHDAKTWYQLVRQQDASIPEISPSSLDNIHRHGVGKRIFLKLTKAMKKSSNVLLNFMLPNKYPLVDRALAVNSNASGWLGLLLMYQELQNDSDVNQQELLHYKKLVDFVSQRCEQEIVFYEENKKKFHAGETYFSDKQQYWEKRLHSFYQQYTQLDEPILITVEQILQDIDVQALTKSQKVELIENVYKFEFDFLLNCIACYDIGYLEVNNVLSVDADNKPVHSAICRIMDRYTQPDNNETCFHSCWEVIRCILDENDIDVSNRQLASFIPINQKEGTVETLKDAQYNVLKKWFKQQDLPSAEKLRSFVDAFSESINFAWRNHLLLLSKMALGVDALLVGEIKRIEREFGSDIDVTAIWKRVFSQYTQYYQYHCHQHFLSK